MRSFSKSPMTNSVTRIMRCGMNVQLTEAGAYYPHVQQLYGTGFEREKDRREVSRLVQQDPPPEMQAWYDEARSQSCVWWLDHHLVARHALKSCLYCGVCTSQCPAAQYYEDYNPRTIVDVALSRDEAQLGRAAAIRRALVLRAMRFVQNPGVRARTT